MKTIKDMKIFTPLMVGWSVVTLALALALPAGAGEKAGKKKAEIKLGDCPAAVQRVIQEKAEGGKILEVEKATRKDGSVVYEAEVRTAGGKKVEVKVDADGKLLAAEDADEDKDGDNRQDKDGENEEDN